MNALAGVFVTRRCSRCKGDFPLEDMKPGNGLCRPCHRDYNRQRNAKLREGEWRPHETVLPVNAPPAPEPRQPPTEADEAQLRLALEMFVREFGFTALRVAYTRLEGEIAKRRRLDLAREGWIA